jgi:3-methyladenine DNA glycosylase AlkD
MTNMTAADILAELKTLGSEQQKKTFLRHGAREPFYGVKIEDLKKIQKRIKVNYQLALDLYDTGNSDAMYLAGLIADDAKMTKKDLRKWADGAYWYMIAGFTVPWVAAGSPHGWDLALEWIDSKKPTIAAAGWSTLSGIVASKEDSELDIPKIKKLLERVQKTIHDHPDRLGYAMNAFVIAVGGAVKELSAFAIGVAKKIGTFECDMGDTSCKTPSAVEYIKKIKDKGKLGVKRKMLKC